MPALKPRTQPHRFLACMVLFALVVQRSYAAIDSAAKFKDPDQVAPSAPAPARADQTDRCTSSQNSIFEGPHADADTRLCAHTHICA